MLFEKKPFHQKRSKHYDWGHICITNSSKRNYENKPFQKIWSGLCKIPPEHLTDGSHIQEKKKKTLFCAFFFYPVFFLIILFTKNKKHANYFFVVNMSFNNLGLHPSIELLYYFLLYFSLILKNLKMPKLVPMKLKKKMVICWHFDQLIR